MCYKYRNVKKSNILENIPGKTAAISDRSREPWNRTFLTRLLRDNINCNKKITATIVNSKMDISINYDSNVH